MSYSYSCSTKIFTLTVALILIFMQFNFYSTPNSGFKVSGEESGSIILNKYYLDRLYENKTVLVPYPPDDGPDNITTLTIRENLIADTGMLDRKYDPAVKPEVHLYIDSFGKAGLVIDITMTFTYFDEANRLLLESPVHAYFEPYTTLGRTDRPEDIVLVSSSYSDTPRDIPYSDYGAFVAVKLNLTGESPDDRIDIYCGKSGYRSNVLTPYPTPYSAEDDGVDEGFFDRMGRGCYLFVAAFVIALVVFVVLLHFRDMKKK
ncbi:MAG: hypothetical protein JSV49_07585 [Thermoplasmata archaeon]|nr:MAG: hypothetical protein JSV49_07585 [Thermoplasmata archaeon]